MYVPQNIISLQYAIQHCKKAFVILTITIITRIATVD